jgi:uncharacterized protein
MEHRSLPRAPAADLSILGFGCARLPTVGGDPARIDEPAAAALLREAIEGGVNYVESGWTDHGGEGEAFLGRALGGALRERVHLATRLPVGLVAGEGDWERLLKAQLARLQTERIDFYLLHGLSRSRWELVRRTRGLEALEQARAEGRIGHVGFAFHGPAALFEEILGGHAWDLCELELDFLDEGGQPGLEALRSAAARGVGVVAAEPLRGDALAFPPPVVQDAWARSERAWSPAQWSLRWVWDHPEVSTAVSGFGSGALLRDGLRAASDPQPLSGRDRQVIAEVRRLYRSRRRVPCTICGSCLPCPMGIAIPEVLSLFNDAMFHSRAWPVEEYRAYLRAGKGADQCASCGDCEPRCPEGISIAEELEGAHDYLSAGGAGAPRSRRP